MESKQPLTLKEQIELIPTQELLTALMHRFENAVFAGTFHRNDQQFRSTRYLGDHHKCAGLAMSVANEVLECYTNAENPMDPTDL